MSNFVADTTLTAAALNAAFAEVTPPSASLLGGTGTTFTIVTLGTGLALASGTLSATGGSGTVTQVVAQGGPFLASGTVTSSGTISNSTTSLTASGVLLGAGTGAVTALGSTGTATTVLHGNASGAPSFSAVSLVNDITGILGVAAGGTGLGAVGFSGGVLAYVGSGTLASSAVLAAHHLVIGGGPGLTPATIGGLGTTGQPLTSAGAGNDPLFQALDLSSSTVVTNRLAFANVGTLAATSIAGNATGAGASMASVAIGTGLTLIGSPGTLSATGGASSLIVTDGTTTVNPAGTISVTGAVVNDLGGGDAEIAVTGGSGGTVTKVVTEGGPFLTNGTITGAGTITNATASLTPHGVLLGEGTGPAVATAAGTDGQLLVATTAADPAFVSMSGDATITKAGVITVTKIGGVTPATVANTGAVLNSGTVQTELAVTLTGTAAGTLTISPGTGTKISVVNLPASGGTVTLAYAGIYDHQTSRVQIKQGATAGVVVLNAGTVNGFVFFASGGPTSFTVTPTAGAIDELGIEGATTAYARVMALAQGATA